MTPRFTTLFAVVLGFCGVLGGGCGGATPSELLDPATGDGGTSEGAVSDGAGHDVAMEASPVDQGVNCPGAGVCPVPAQVCCKGDTSDVCAPAGGCGGISIPCDDTADCVAAGHPNTVCCLTGSTTGMPPSIACLSASQCVGGQGRTPICDKNAPNICPNGQSCQPSTMTLPGFDICR